MSFTKNDQAVVLNRESLQYLANCIRLVHSLPDLLNDVLPSQTTTYSSYKVTELLNTLNTDLQNYVNSALGNSSHLKKEIVSVAPTNDSADENTIYLVKDASGGYEQYLKINGVVTSLGSTSAINNVYTKTESDAKFALLSTLNSLITTVGGLNDLTTTDKTSIVNGINELKTNLTTHTDDTDVHTSATEKASYVKKTDIVDNLTSTDTDKPLSANQGKILNDKKVDKTDITTTINSTSTDTQVPTAKSIYYNCIEGIEINQTTIDTYGTEILKYPLGIWRIRSNDIASKFTDLPVKVAGRIEITSVNPDTNITPWNNKYSYRAYNFEPYTWENYIRKIETSGTVGVFKYDTGWRRLCTTSAADVGVKNITFTNITNYKPSDNIPMKYSITNGICYVSGGIYCVSPSNSYPTVCTLPKPKNGWKYCKTFRIDDSRDESSTVIMLINENGELELSMGTATGEYRFTFSYPVKESE